MRRLRNGTVEHSLTPKECELLAVFIEHRGQVLSRRFLMREVWCTAYVKDTRTLEVHVHWLRRKLQRGAADRTSLIHTIRGVGYTFQPPDSPEWEISPGAARSTPR